VVDRLVELPCRLFAAAEMSLREMGTPSLLVALDYLVLLAELRPDRFEPAAMRWHGRLEMESVTLPIVESQLALALLADLGRGNRDVVPVLKRLLRRIRPTMLPRVS
jgi:hypothetical protein